MLKGYSEIKRQARDSEIGTRSILSAGIQKLHPSSIAKLPKFESISERFVITKVQMKKLLVTQLLQLRSKFPPNIR